MVGVVAHAPAAHALTSGRSSSLAPPASRRCAAQPATLCLVRRNDAALGTTAGTHGALHSPPTPWRSTRAARRTAGPPAAASAGSAPATSPAAGAGAAPHRAAPRATPPSAATAVTERDTAPDALAHSASAPAAATAAAAAAAAGGGAGVARHPAAVVLGIESSCDDTAVAVVTSHGVVLGEAIATQADIVAQWGGVVPNLARDAHVAAIDRTVDLALRAAGVRPQQLSAIAVTIGPGLGLCLRVGASKARDMARQYGIPLVSVHHMEAHALVARLPPAAAAAAAPAVRVSAASASAQASEAGGEDGEAGPAGSGRPLGLETEAQQQAPDAPSTSAAAPAVDGPGTGPSPRAGDRSTAHSSDVVAPSATGAASWTSHAPPVQFGPGSAAGGGAGAAAAVDAAEVLSDVSAAAAVAFPFLCLLVSGGHNLLVLVRGVGQYVQLGVSVDDALGEAYDKIARLLSLDLRPHGGAALEALAREGDPKACKFAVPMRQHATCDFSFAGLKTNTRLAIEQQLAPEAVARMTPQQLRKVKADIAASFQAVAVTHLVEKTRRGVAWARELAPELRQLVVAGGVACNQVVRGSLQALADKESLELVLPPPRWCTDNGVMVAWTGIERLALGWAEPPPPPLPLSPPQPTTITSLAGTAATAAVTPATHPASASHTTATTEQQGPVAGDAAAAAAAGPRPAQEAEWVELKPRWPLTSELHPRTAAARLVERRSVKRVRLHTPLSDLTPPSMGPAAAAGPEAGARPGVAAVGAAAAAAGPGV